MTKHDLKELAAMGAELGAAKADNERLREALRWYEEKVAECRKIGSLGDNARQALDRDGGFRARDALSQQPEPTDTFTAVDMATAAAQGFRDGQAAVEQDTAQDETEPVYQFQWREIGEGDWIACSHSWFRFCEASHERDTRVVEVTRPAQTEQKPVGWIHEDELPEGYPYDAMFPFSKVDVVRMFPVYAPIAQTAPQGKFRMGDLVKKSTGSEWEGRVVGWYSTEQTPEGYAVESEAHAGSVQIYPAKALEAVE